MSSTTVMKAKARLIKEETQEGANTAARVGGLFEDIVDYLDSADVTSSLDITPYVTTGTRIAKFKVNGEETTIFAPSNGGSGGGGGSSYDDTEIREIINELDKALDDTTELANSEKERLDGVIEDIDANVKQKMADAIDFAEWVQGNFPEGETGYQSGWDEKTKQFLQVVGMWDTETDSPAVTTTKWSKITQDVDDIYAEVTSITTGGEVTAEMVQSWIGTSVQNKIAELNLGTTYATQDDTGEILKWLYSALKGSSSEYTTYNQFVSAAKNGASTAISELRTYVEQLKDGSFIANANIVSKVDDAIAELYTSASSNYAKTYIFSTIDKNSEDIAAIVVGMTGSSSTVDLATRLGNWKAGVITTAKLDSAVTSLIASHQSGDDVNSAVIRLIANNMGNQIALTTDMLTLSDGDTLGGLIFTSNSIAFFNACYEMHEVSGKYLNPTTRKPTDSSVGAQSILYTETRLSYNNVGTETCVLNGHFNPFELVYGNTMYDEYGVTISNSSNSVLAKLSSEGLTVSGNELSSNGLSLTSGSQIEISGSGGNLQIYLSNSGLDIGNTTYADDEIIAQGAFTIGPATFNNSTLALSTNALTFGGFQIQNVTLGTTTYLCISPNSSVNSGLLIAADGTLGVNVNGVFKRGFDLSSTGLTDIAAFVNSGSTQGGYTIKNGLIVSL